LHISHHSCRSHATSYIRLSSSQLSTTTSSTSTPTPPSEHHSQRRLDRKIYRFLFLGAPGVGKGTYGQLIAPVFRAKILGSGDLIRQACKLTTNKQLAKELNIYLQSGSLVPDDIIIPMVIEQLRNMTESFILDGFPRTLYQANRIHSEYQLDLAVHFFLPDEVLIKKIIWTTIM